jgi:hypothetical protein
VTLQLGFVGVSFAADGTNVRLKIEEKIHSNITVSVEHRYTNNLKCNDNKHL